MCLRLISIFLLFCSINAGIPDFSQVDKVMFEGLGQAFPGGIITVANQTSIIYQKTYGHLTYQRDIHGQQVTLDTKYEVASMTKVMATTLAFMNMYSSNSFKLDDPVAKYIQNYDTNKKGNTTIANLLLHNAGLPYDVGPLPANKETLINEITYIKPIFQIGSQFHYSNLGFIMLGQICEKITKKTFADYTTQNRVFAGLRDTGFNPPESEIRRIAPTEFDNEIRKRIVRGQAHERQAYVMKGVAGHSGYFTTANDITKFIRILLNNGKLPQQPVRILPQSVVKLFTSRVQGLSYQNSRGYGFDTACPSNLMKDCFGHDGSTGASAWADRERKIVFTILTNRGHPDAKNNKYFEKYKTLISNAIIKAIDAAKSE